MKEQWKQNALLYFQNFDIIATGQFPISSKWPAEPIFAPVYSDGQIIVIFAIFSATTVFRNNIIFQFQQKTSGKEFYFSLIRSKIFEKNECVFIKVCFWTVLFYRYLRTLFKLIFEVLLDRSQISLESFQRLSKVFCILFQG